MTCESDGEEPEIRVVDLDISQFDWIQVSMPGTAASE
jgi:hypothetical protein